MPDAFIPRRPELPPALDYAFLRAEGLAHIQRLSGLLWTDHNLHDPGITILEALCYALTDLSYRARFPTTDLLTGSDGRIDPLTLSSLPPAHEVLPTAPRTIADYRRLLLHIAGVRNAWLDPMQDASDRALYRLSEIPIYADCAEGKLSFDPDDASGKANPAVSLSGLYKVQLELEIDDVLGSMNESALLHRLRRGALKGVVLAFDCNDADFLAGRIDFSAEPVAVEAVELTANGDDFEAAIDLYLDDGSTASLRNCTIRIVERRPRHDRPELEVNSTDLGTALFGAAGDDPLPRFWAKQRKRASTLATVRCALHAHRGLCEDFLAIATIRPYRVGICADIEVRPDVDLEQVQAQVFRSIETCLSPPLQRRTLEELLRDGQQPDEIFNGPFIDFSLSCSGQPVFTKGGFILDADLERSDLRRTVQASDLIARVMDIDGVEAISGLQLRPYDSNGRPAADAANWTLPVPADHQAVFHVEGSKLLFRRAGIPYRARLAEFERTLAYLRALDRKSGELPTRQQLSLPRGRWRKPTAFHSVQYDLPATYKIGAARISPNESRERIACARQLKAYLAFFDHLLAGYLGQLALLPRLYSLDSTLAHSAFSAPLQGIAGSLEADFCTEFYSATAPDTAPAWAQLAESGESFRERRSRLLDHLIARFAERFADYALMSFRLSGDRLKSADELIADKIRFLSDYPRMSRERGQGTNLRPDDAALVWHGDNVSGLERRIARLFGIAARTDRKLHCASHQSSLIQTVEHGDAFQLWIANAKGEALFVSDERFADAETAQAAADAIYPVLREESSFVVLPVESSPGWHLLIQSQGATLRHRTVFDADAEAWRVAHALIERYDQLLEAAACGTEGMHLIEHILLRPQAVGDRLLQVCLPAGCVGCGEEDPYSFRAAVVLPYWPPRFRDSDFRALFERSLREEAPAHVHLRICWIGQQQMIALDAALHAWRTAKAAVLPDAATVSVTAARLIEVLESLSSVFPVAVLHDCDADDAKQQPVVRLGATALGSFKT